MLRHPSGPSYRLGPGLIALGEAARRGYPELPYAQDRMREVGNELGLECLASAVVGPEIVILAKSGDPAPLSVTAAIGQRVPLVPPLATVFFAWSDEAAVAGAFGSWVGAGSGGGPALTDNYRRALDAVRKRGYAVGLENPVRERLGRTFATQLARGQLTAPEVTELVAALADEDYQLIDEAGHALLAEPPGRPDLRRAAGASRWRSRWWVSPARSRPTRSIGSASGCAARRCRHRRRPGTTDPYTRRSEAALDECSHTRSSSRRLHDVD